jgi:hypothetical protein
LDELDNERKANLFEALLRDLQVEGVPLLGCDADQVHTLQAAIWTTMAELCEQNEAQKACLILENIPLAALKMFVDDFLVLKTQADQMEYLPELQRVSASLVGKGVGPAILLEVTAKPARKIESPTKSVYEYQCSAAMKAFTDRVVLGNGVPPTAIGLGDEGSAPPIVYRYTFSSNTCAILSMFWNCVCEMLSVPYEEAGTVCLMMPAVEEHDRFARVAQLMSRSLCLYQGDAVFSLVHFHPEYDRAIIQPVDKPAFGHLPPIGWLRPMIQANGMEGSKLDDASLQKSNYQRRSPVSAVNIVRNSLLADPIIVDIELENGVVTQASGLEVYCRNTLALAAADERILEAAHHAEMAIVNQ